jgi:SAM-dependent methyltransferase
MDAPSLLNTGECQVCGNTDLRLVLDLGNHPLCDDLIKVGDNRTSDEYPIQILLCPECLTANQAVNVPKETLFNRDYHYRARFTGDVVEGMVQLVDLTEQTYGEVKGRKILDVGCNDGSLLSAFASRGGLCYGVEPTDACLDADARHRIWQDYFGPELAQTIATDVGQMDFITFTNVFAHIENFDQMIEAVRVLSGSNTKIIIENHYLGAVLERKQFDTFYHEHPRTYSLKSFRFIAEKLGMKVEHISFPKRYGGNIRAMIGHGGALKTDKPAGFDENNYFEKFEELNRFIAHWKRAKRLEIETLSARHGPLTAKAFPGRAAILLRLLGMDTQHIRHVAEKPGSKKIGHYIPGTRIPIVSDDDVDYAGERHILNLAWHIESEIVDYLKSHGFRGELISIL